MEQWRKDARKEAVITDINTLVPGDHLLRKIERVMDYEWLYERLDPYYNHEVGRPSIDPVVLVKMVLLQHLFGIPSLRQTYREIQANDTFTCPCGGILRHTTTNKDGRRIYRSTPKHCANCPNKLKCGANEKGQKMLMTHIWQEHLDLVEQLRKTDRGKEIYAMRKETIERVFADAKEKHAMRYTHHRGLPAVTRWVKLKFAARRLKKVSNMGVGKPPIFKNPFNILAFLCGNTSLCKRMSWCSLTG